MKMIIAIVRPFQIDRIIAALERIESFPGLTVIDSEGFGQRLMTSGDALNPLKANKRIEIACSDETVEQIIAAIRQTARTGKKGDGIIFVAPLEKAVLI